MKKIIFAAAALSFAVLAYAPVSASASPIRDNGSVGSWHKHRDHRVCKVIKTKVRYGHRWVVRTRKVCR